MRVIFAPDKFKGSCPADKAASAMARGWLSVFPGDEAILIPVADGGEGMLEAMRAACGGELFDLPVDGPLGDPIQACWLKRSGSAVIEMSRASGLHLVEKARRDVLRATTYGTGQLLLAALDAGCRSVIIGIGGSATNDGGMGLLRALGARFYGPAGELTAPYELAWLDAVDFTGFDKRLSSWSVIVACDVSNPLCGREGATAVFGPQKGATDGDIEYMDNCLHRLAAMVAAQQGRDYSRTPGAGAAGGLGWALMQCCGAGMMRGIDVVLDAAGFDKLLPGASLVVTGEGSLDSQTAMGKAPVGIAQRASKANVPVAVVAGRLGSGYDAVYSMGINCAVSITPGPMALEQAMESAEALIEAATGRLARGIKLGMNINKGKGGDGL